MDYTATKFRFAEQLCEYGTISFQKEGNKNQNIHAMNIYKLWNKKQSVGTSKRIGGKLKE